MTTDEHKATPQYRHFEQAVREAKSYQGALDLLHAEALVEQLADAIWADIQEDIAEGVVPADVATFGELRDRAAWRVEKVGGRRGGVRRPARRPDPPVRVKPEHENGPPG